MRTTDTIAAISSSLTPAGIGIVRLSGEKAVEIADRIYRGKTRLEDSPTHTIHYGFVYDGEEKVDQVLIMLMRAPRTYTGEDVVEIDCHGGTFVLQRILALCFQAGAIPAEPGEFTKRAFLNGKIDLSQAEAVSDIINAENTSALKVGLGQLGGKLSAEIRSIRADLLQEIAFIEAALDDPEHYSLDEYRPQLEENLHAMKSRTEMLLQKADTGMILKSGVNTVILGKPNSGKSSLYNLLAGSQRAIVTDVAGTTRDVLREQIRMHDITLNISDTAGIRQSDDLVEKIGVDRAREAAENADLILCVVDGSKPFTAEDKEVLEYCSQKKTIVLLNKSDLGNVSDIDGAIRFSAKTGEGLDLLEQRIRDLFYHGELNLNDEIYITEARHKAALSDADRSMKLAIASAESGMPEDIISVDLNDAYESLGMILGERVDEDIINEIFSKFCMGK